MSIDSAFTQLPSLMTERLCLRQVQTDDAEALFAIKSDPEVTARYGQEPHQSLEDTSAWLQRLEISYELREALFWGCVLRADYRVIGGCTLWNFEPGFHYAELGYELHPAYWGQSLMAEALRAVLSYGLGELGLHRIEACPLAGNAASQKLLLKLGFKYEGNLRQRVFFRGRFEDQLYFGLLREEWPASTPAASR